MTFIGFIVLASGICLFAAFFLWATTHPKESSKKLFALASKICFIFLVITGAIDYASIQTDPARPKPVVKPPAPAPVIKAGQDVVVPHNNVGFLTRAGDIIDCDHYFPQGIYTIGLHDKITLVDTSVTTMEYLSPPEPGEGPVEVVTADGLVTQVQMIVPWSVVPENVAVFKCKIGGTYTDQEHLIIRPAARDVISHLRWSDGSIRNRESLKEAIQQSVEKYSEKYYRRLGFGDRASNMVRYGSIDIVDVTHDTK